MKLSENERTATEYIDGLFESLADAGIITINKPDFMRTQFDLLRDGVTDDRLSDAMLTLIDALRACAD